MAESKPRLDKLPLRRLTLEAATIILSILVAFWIDAWWADVVETRQEEAALLRLRSEFEFNREELDQARLGHGDIRTATLGLLDLTRPEGPTPADNRELSQLLTHFSRWITFNPSAGTLGSLLASGGLGLIREDSLRLELAAWPGLIEDLNEDERMDRGQVVEYIIPFLQEHYAYRSVVAARDSAAVGPGSFPQTPDELLTNRRFDGILAARLWRTTRILAEAEKADVAIGRILKHINSELKDGTQ